MRQLTMIWILIVLALAACAGEATVSDVTPLPSAQPTAEPEATSEAVAEPVNDALPTPSLQPTVEPEATATDLADNQRSSGGNSFQLMTPTPSENKLEPGVAREYALATDTAMTPDIEDPITFDEDVVSLQFSEFYDGFSIRTGLILSDKLKSLDGQRVVIEGYIAPPLKPRLDFFVLTRIQLAYCPFCSTDVEWPDDIALAYLPEQQVLSSEYPVRLTGQLEVGSSIDAETGMVSLVRIYVEDMETLR